ncbi:UNVERIFIED_CONTAM: hypothetical protein NCL1_41878 [Trichonephila clavipes]
MDTIPQGLKPRQYDQESSCYLEFSDIKINNMSDSSFLPTDTDRVDNVEKGHPRAYASQVQYRHH